MPKPDNRVSIRIQAGSALERFLQRTKNTATPGAAIHEAIAQLEVYQQLGASLSQERRP